MSLIDDTFDSIRYVIPSYFFLLMTLFIIISPIDPIKAAQEFTAYRLQQYDIQGVKIGSRSIAFNMEAQTSYSKLLSRKCLLLKLMEVSVASIRMAISQNVGSIVILLPVREKWDIQVKEQIDDLEKELLPEEFSIAIYFAFETKDVSEIYDNVRQLTEASKASSATQALIHSITSNGYLLYTASQSGKTNIESQITNFFGKLVGNGIEEQLPTILIVAHYDSMGMAPSLSYGYDSNGSGVVALLQLMKVFSRLYAMPKSHGKFNLAFLLTGGGKLNYIGTKKWLDDLFEHPDGGVLSADRLSAVLCLDRLGLGSSGLEVHVSRPPKEGSTSQHLVTALATASRLYNTESTLMHRRINLHEDELHREHERFSMRKIPAMTVSAAPANRSNSILDDHINPSVLVRNVRVLTEAVVRVVYDLPSNGDNEKGDDDIVSNEWISSESVLADLAAVVRHPRGQQLLGDSHHPVLAVLERALRRHLPVVRVSKATADARDPEYGLYGGCETVLLAHRVRPALFDCVVAAVVAAYLGLVYLLAEHGGALTASLLRATFTRSPVVKEKHI